MVHMFRHDAAHINYIYFAQLCTGVYLFFILHPMNNGKQCPSMSPNSLLIVIHFSDNFLEFQNIPGIHAMTLASEWSSR